MSGSPEIRLLITGKMGSGKSFAGDYLATKHGAVCWSRTELMKRLAHSVADYIDAPDPILERIFADPELRAEVRDELFAYSADYEPEPGKPRRLYQDITEICQSYDPLCFERELDARINTVVCDFSLIDDVRSAAAFDYFAGRGYRSLRIDAPETVCRQRMLDRDGYLPSERTFRHPSETELDDVAHEFTIENDGRDLAEFYRQLDELVMRLRSGENDGAAAA